ncbi:MAG: hypothetical protein MSS98_03925, partial [Alphaproteobacteria bacterium]|nr:hypothetical protein [Alphaproteobacteria bacterium]
MPRFGWKCFVGSFLFSLAAVFAAAKVYFLLPAEKSAEQTENFENLETKNIDLFANDEENNPIIEKFNEINKPAAPEAAAPVSAAENDITEEVPEIVTAEAEPVLPQAEETFDNSSSVLYAPDDDDFSAAEKPAQAIALKNDIISEPAEEKAAAEAENPEQNSEIADAENEEPLKIADASEAKAFTIPLQHNFETPKQNVKVSSEADNSQVALASNNVRMQNLGTQNKIASASVETSVPAEKVQETPYVDPWVVATAGNEHIAKNKLDAINNSEEVKNAAADLKAPEPAKSDNEKKVAYKMMKNILIPIPEDIANDENLTPQLSYSEENKKLSKKLMQSGELSGDTSAHDDEETEKDSAPAAKPQDIGTTPLPQQPAADSQTKSSSSSASLTDSIAAWFSSSAKDKSTNTESEKQSSSGSGDSAFSKLLGLGKKDNSGIAPSELKLAFQPNRAEISGQTLEWLKAFSDNAVKNDDVFIEIRIDGSGSYELQQKRLNLLYSILINNGVDYNKINIIFTDREPNSFIIRNVRYASEEDANKARKKA